MTEFQISRNGEQSGPLSQEDIELALNEGTLSPEDMIWCEGMEEWDTVASVFDMEKVVTIEQVPMDDPRVSPTSASSITPPPTVSSAAASRPSPRVVPTRDRRRDYAPSRPSVGKIVGFSILGLFVAGLLAIPWFIGKKVESAMAELSEVEDSNIKLISTAHDRGFLTSQSKMSLALGDERLDEFAAFHSEISHGPIAKTRDGLKFVGAYSYSTLDLSEMGDDAKAQIFEIWGNEEPIEIRSSVSYGGVGNTEISVSPANYEDGGNALTFDGGTVRFKHQEGGGSAVAGSMNLKSAKMLVSGTTIEMEPSGGSFDFEQGERFNADLTFGQTTAESADGGFKMRVNASTYEADMKGIGSESLILLGEAAMTMPYIEAEMGGAKYRIEQVTLDQHISKTGSTIESKGGFKIAKIDISEDPNLPGLAGMLAAPLAGGLKLETGIRGVDVEAMDAFQQKAQAMRTAPDVAPGNELSDAELKRTQKITSELIRAAIELMQPGTQLFLNQSVSDQLQIDLVLGFTGDKPLLETATGREAVAALAGTLKIQIDPALLENPIVGELVAQQAQAGMGTLDENGFSFEGDLTGGVVSIGGQPTPILDMFGPVLDQPLDWESVIEMMTGGTDAE